MSNLVKLTSSSIQILHTREPRRLEFRIVSLLPNAVTQSNKTGRIRLIEGGNVHQGRKFLAYNGEIGGSVQSLDNAPVSIELGSIVSETQFDRVMAEAQQLEEPIIIVWMASWCRKCIYLKPKLEKLAAEYFPRIRFFHIDVNNVSHKLVVRAGVTVSSSLTVEVL
ncbi:OLC1v1026088C1 [Oldenlandia corymbosa var. corymbosa]|uniref:OLC1v1026088C1 n=1 Tax=Oldenlandia corymbosa var. corymbosa TaxID=529605 RepID=A0AAV1C6C4_OLDCO|nr:OLC1v1026088C1 [Oldenlandia corymbosa var. corymbosa]